MDKLINYRNVIKRVLSNLAELINRQQTRGVETLCAFDGHGAGVIVRFFAHDSAHQRCVQTRLPGAVIHNLANVWSGNALAGT